MQTVRDIENGAIAEGAKAASASRASNPEKITELRALLAGKFPQPAAKTGGMLQTGVPEVELRRGVVTEISGSVGSSALFLEAMIHSAQSAGVMVALVDGFSGFDPAQIPAGSRLLWVLCKDAQSAIKSADLLLRDGNLALVMLDLQMNPAKELRGIPSTTWYRFQRILEQSTMAFVVITRRPMVSSAADRIELRNRWTLHAMRQRRSELRLEVECAHRRSTGGMEPTIVERQIA